MKHSFKNATGKIDYTLINDYMFRAVMQTNEKVLKGLVCSLLHLNSEEIASVIIMNTIELGKAIDEKNFVLDLKVLLNDTVIINIELQVVKQLFWADRSLVYLCRAFDTLKKGDKYHLLKPAYHIGILDFTPFPDYPELYATNKMMNIKKHYIYNDKFVLNVLDLNQIELATDEDKAYKVDYWARLFKAKTWEDFIMLAQKDDVFNEMGETMYSLNQDESIRYWCEACEKAEHDILSMQADVEYYKNKSAEKDNIIAEKDAQIAMLLEQLRQNKS